MPYEIRFTKEAVIDIKKLSPKLKNKLSRQVGIPITIGKRNNSKQNFFRAVYRKEISRRLKWILFCPHELQR